MSKLRIFTNSLCAATTLTVTASCGSSEDKVTPINTFENDEGIAKIDFEKESQQAHSSFLALASIPHPVAGIAQFKASIAPVVYVPEINNKYVSYQIARCKKEDYESRTIQSWFDVLSLCHVVSETHPQIPFFDLTTPSGNWNWIIRACIAGGTKQSIVCHKATSATRTSVKFERNDSLKVEQLTASIHERKAQINALTTTIQSQARELALAYQQCDMETWKKTENLIKRSIIANIVGYGSALLIKIYSRELLGSTRATGSWQEKFSDLWTQDTADQKAIVRTLLWLFTSKDDFFRSCTTAHEIQFESYFNLMKVKEQQMFLAKDVDQLKQHGIDIGDMVFQ